MGTFPPMPAGLLWMFALFGVPNVGDRTSRVLYPLMFGLPLVLPALGGVLSRLERIEALLKSKST